MMAMPDGCITPGLLKLPIQDAGSGGYDSADICHMYFIYRLPILPQWWTTNDAHHTDLGFNKSYPGTPMRVKIRFNVYHDESGGAGTIYTSWFTAYEGQASFTRDITATINTPTWQTQDTDTNYALGVKLFTNVQGGKPPFFMVAEMQVYYDGHIDNQVEIAAVEIEAYIDDPDTDTVEYHNHGAGRTYAPDMPASSWHVCHCLARTYMAYLDEARPIFATPLSGIADL